LAVRIARNNSGDKAHGAMSYSPYVHPEVYEVAFSFRDYSSAVDFIVEAAGKAGLAQIGTVVDLGCGPGQYCREFARRGVKSFGVDLSPEMVAYAQQKCSVQRLDCRILQADFRDFQLPQKADLAVCMMATFGCLLSNSDVTDHLGAVADNLTDGGIYVIEFPHPRDLYDPERNKKDVWDIEKGGMKVHTDWGSDGVFDPLTEIDSATVKMSYEKDGRTFSFCSPDHARRLGFGQFRTLVKLSGRFEIVATYGDLDVYRPLDNSRKSWRMIPVLRRIA
jgi:SAM-dependent methyltransferase